METTQAGIFNDLSQVVTNIETEGYTVDHLSHRDRTIAVRTQLDGNLDLTLSNGFTTEEHCGLSLSQALLMAEVYLFGTIESYGSVVLWINQALRNCTIVKVTPTRVRVEYELPRAGTVGGWYHYVDLNGDRFIGHGDVQVVAKRIADRAKQAA